MPLLGMIPKPPSSFSYQVISRLAASLASHMRFSCLTDFAFSCPVFNILLYFNVREVVSSCLITQYGYKPDLCAEGYNLRRSPLPAYPEGSDEQRLLIHLPLLNFLVLEEGLSSLPEYRRLLAILASASGAAFSDEENEKLYGPGLHALLRFIIRYHSLRRTIGSRDRRSKEMCIFLCKHYTVWGIRQMAGVYECLCDILTTRLAAMDDEELNTECAYLIAELGILDITAPTGGWSEPLREEESPVLDEQRRYLRREHNMFFCNPVNDALRRLTSGEGFEGMETGGEDLEPPGDFNAVDSSSTDGDSGLVAAGMLGSLAGVGHDEEGEKEISLSNLLENWPFN